MNRVLWRLRHPSTHVVASGSLAEQPAGYVLTVVWNERSLVVEPFQSLVQAVERSDFLRTSFIGRGWEIAPEKDATARRPPSVRKPD